MKFCPTCEVKLKKSDSGLRCPKCDYVEKFEEKSTKVEEEFESEFKTLDNNEMQETLPTVTIQCEKCGNNKAVWWMLQTRSADEPTTQFYRCTECKHTWRDYT